MAKYVQSHFEFPKDVDLNGAFKAKCRYCATSISGHGKTTSNFLTHLKRKHREVYLTLNKDHEKFQTLVKTFAKPKNNLKHREANLMEVLNRVKLDQKVEIVKEDPEQRQILRTILKYEMQSLLQRLADIGEESVVVTANIVDGTNSVLASHRGENFLHNYAVSSFMDNFVHYLYVGETPDLGTRGTSSSDGWIVMNESCEQENNLPEFLEPVSYSDQPYISYRSKKRKSMLSCHNNHDQSIFNPAICSVAKKKPTTEHFPAYSTFSPTLYRNSSDNLSNSVHFMVHDASETLRDEVTSIKTEPHDSDDLETAFHHVSQQKVSENLETAGIKVSNIKLEPDDVDEFSSAVSDISHKGKIDSIVTCKKLGKTNTNSVNTSDILGKTDIVNTSDMVKTDSMTLEKNLKVTNRKNQEQTSLELETPVGSSCSIQSLGINHIIDVQSNGYNCGNCENFSPYLFGCKTKMMKIEEDTV